LVEFTGERVIPGRVDADLWSEHFARYAFARRFAQDRIVLDAGCGTGYGSAELAQSAQRVVGVDIAPEALEYARSTYPLPNLEFTSASCLKLPFENQIFDIAVAFEVIEHLADYRQFLAECARVLRPDGVLIVSTPNKRYYGESRDKSGPNPYHQHEFEPAEFMRELEHIFKNVTLLAQNRVECFAFHPVKIFWPADARIDGGGGAIDDAHFLIGVCSRAPLPAGRSFVYVPKAANLLREREQHVKLLQAHLSRTQDALTETREERRQLLSLFEQQTRELEEHNRWAAQLNGELQQAGARNEELQLEFAREQAAALEVARGYAAKVEELEAENRAKTDWAMDTEARLGAEIERTRAELAECARLLDAAESTVEERTLWARRLEAERDMLAAQLAATRASRWVRLGRKLGVGPALGGA
jgi:ubiquinone/menaquinone biosynthesis C-methylase UbiE